MRRLPVFSGVFNSDGGVGYKIIDFEGPTSMFSALFLGFGPFGQCQDATIEPLLSRILINQVILRLMVALGTVLYIWYYIAALDDPRAAVLTSVLMGTANFIGLGQIWYQNSKLAIPKEHKDIYPIFGSLPPGDFKNIMKVAKRYTTSEDKVLTTEGTAVENLYFILSGELNAAKKGYDFPLPDGIFVGEVAYLAGQVSSATTSLKSGAEIIEWDVPTLVQKSKKNARFKLALEALISNDLARKVTVAVAPIQAN